MPSSIALYVLFFLSGISGLVYQIVWVRQFGNIFGNSIHSASLVTAVFMLGLGVGSYFAGAFADRQAGRRSLVAAYGVAEVLIGLFGVLLAAILPHLAGVSASISSYAVGGNGWFELSTSSVALRYGVAVALLTPVTLLMGATLTLLIRHLIARDLELTGLRVGALYGFNTAGAAVGSLLTDLAFVPALGLLQTQRLAAFINLSVGVGALVLSRSVSSAASPSRQEEPARRARDADGARILGMTSAAIFLSGFAAMGLEIVWFRILGGALGQFRSVLSILLTVILSGIWIGSSLGGWAQRRWGRPELLFAICQSLLAASTLALLWRFDPLWAGELVRQAYASLPPPAELSGARQYAALFRATLPLVAVPAVLLGASFSLANANVQRAEAQVGRRAGALYLANTIGAVVGSLGAGFLMIPWLGGQWSVLILTAIAALAAIPFYLSTRGKLTEASAPTVADYVFLSGLVVAFGSVGAFVLLVPEDALLQRAFSYIPAYEVVLARSEGPNEIIAVTANPGGSRRLWTNGHSMSSTLPPGQRYMRAFSHVPLLQIDEPRDVLVICFGVGNTLHAASLHPTVHRLEVADLSRHVLSYADTFAATNGGILRDPRVRVYVNDGRQHLRMVPPGSFDLVTLEPPPIAFAGVAALYSTEFYQLARSRLKPGGFVTQWLPVYQVDTATSLSIVRSFVDVFPQSVLLSGHLGELILLGTNRAGIELDLAVVERNLHARPAVETDLRTVNLSTLTELIGTFVAGPSALLEATAASAPITDDRPRMEYSVLSHYYRTAIPASLFHVADVKEWCPQCADARRQGSVHALDIYLSLLGRAYAQPEFLRISTVDPPPTPAVMSPFDTVGPEAETIGQSGYLREFFAKRGTRGGRPPALPAAGELERIEAEYRASPESFRATLRLGLVRAAQGDKPEAIELLRKATVLEPRSAHARFALGFMLNAMGNRQEAVAAYLDGLALAPRDADARFILAAIYHAIGDPESGTAELRRTLELEPSFGEANAALCSELVRRGDVRGARPHCSHALNAAAKLSADVLDRLFEADKR
ncbi:MAG: fused MFS/spermidine synthase [Deltaproteobacteria bacterium]|nr:fused MFS/spermidine synthase [Deltaproteobacteria bacterium]